MKSVITLTLFLLLLLATSPVYFSLKTVEAAGIEILSHMGYLDSVGYYHIVGEVHNTGQQAVTSVKITAAYYNITSALITTRFEFTYLDILLSDRKSPFEITLTNYLDSAKVDHYTLDVTFSVTAAILKRLKILEHSSFIDETQSLHIVGSIQNTGNSNATNAKVIATYYNMAGQAVAASLKYLDPERLLPLAPGETETFELILGEERASLVKSYELAAESNQYASIVSGEQARDVATTNLAPAKTIIGRGYTGNVTVTAQNQGDFTEDFNVTIYANTTQITTLSFVLANGIAQAKTFSWNTSGFVYGNYTLRAAADVVPGETDTADNNYTSSVPVHVGVPGDISGLTQGIYDGTCNMRDISYMILLFNTRPSSPNWNPNADVNDDGVVNMRDIAIAILNFNKHE